MDNLRNWMLSRYYISILFVYLLKLNIMKSGKWIIFAILVVFAIVYYNNESEISVNKLYKSTDVEYDIMYDTTLDNNIFDSVFKKQNLSKNKDTLNIPYFKQSETNVHFSFYAASYKEKYEIIKCFQIDKVLYIKFNKVEPNLDEMYASEIKINVKKEGIIEKVKLLSGRVK